MNGPLPELQASPGLVLRRVEELSALEPVWRTLETHPASEYGAFLRSTRDSGERPFVMAHQRGRCVTGLLAARLVAENVRWRVGSLALLRGRARVLRVGSGAAMGECSAQGAHATLKELLLALERDEADGIYLHQLERGAPLERAARELPTRLMRDPFPRVVTGWTLDLTEGFEHFLASRSKSVRKGYRRFAQQLEREVPALRAEILAAPHELERIVRDSHRVARLTYHERLGVSFRDDDATRAAVIAALEAGWFRAYLLYDADRPIAFAHGLRFGATFFARDTGFDPAFAEHRPGIYLLVKMIADQAASAARTLDYGVMDAEYKRQFGTNRREYVSSWIFAPTRRGLLLRMQRTLTGSTDRALRVLLDAQRLRRWSRRLGGAGSV